MEEDTQYELRREADFLFNCLFGKTAQPQLVDHYIRAHGSIAELRAFPADELRTVRFIVSMRLNAANIEPWLRRKSGRRHAISVKMFLLVYLAECGEGALRREASGRLKMVVSIAQGVLGLLSGFYLKVRHGLV